jgi:hypothetical protein
VVGLCLISAITLAHAVLLQLQLSSGPAYTALVILFYCVYQSSIGPFYWIYLPELMKIKDICYPLMCMEFCSLCVLFVFFFQDSPYDNPINYYAFGAVNLVTAGLIHWLAVETKGVKWTEVVERLQYEEQSESSVLIA